MKPILFFLGIILAFYLLSYALDTREKTECLTWQSQAKEYPLFYLTQWQADQCEAHDIEVLPNNKN